MCLPAPPCGGIQACLIILSRLPSARLQMPPYRCIYAFTRLQEAAAIADTTYPLAVRVQSRGRLAHFQVFTDKYLENSRL